MVKNSPAKLVIRNYGFIKGRMAEGIIERLFCTLGMDVYPVGLEVKNPHIAALKSKGKIKTKPIEKFEYGPDFIICQHDKIDDMYNIFEIEVKFRKTGNVKITELKKYNDPKILFIFLDTKNVYCIENSEVQKIIKKDKNTKSLSFKKCLLLKDYPIFNFTRKQKNIIHAFSLLIEATLNQFRQDNELSKTIERECKNLCEIELKIIFTDSGNKKYA